MTWTVSGTRTNVPRGRSTVISPSVRSWPNRLPDRRAADAVFLRESQLAGQRLAGPELAGLDLIAQKVGKLPENSTGPPKYRSWQPPYVTTMFGRVVYTS
jgi:hypothetical protein